MTLTFSLSTLHSMKEEFLTVKEFMLMEAVSEKDVLQTDSNSPMRA